MRETLGESWGVSQEVCDRGQKSKGPIQKYWGPSQKISGLYSKFK